MKGGYITVKVQIAKRLKSSVKGLKEGREGKGEEGKGRGVEVG
jgi:hypothetical protein